MDTKGGRVSMSGNGTVFSTRAKFTIGPSAVEVDANANNDGTGYRTVKPRLREVTLSFDRGNGLPWDETMMLNTWDFTIIEDDVGTTHLLTGATFAGFPMIDSENGEVTGVTIKTDTYTQL